MGLHPVATMADHTERDLQRALVTTVWFLRSTLSEALTSTSGFAYVSACCSLGSGLADAAVSLAEMLPCADPPENDLPKAQARLAVCVAIMRAASAHAAIAKVVDDDETRDRERRFATKAIEHAKAEAHRALAILAEIYPDAYEREE